MKKIKITKQHGMIILTILLLSSSLSAFMNQPETVVNAKIIIKFNDYEVYELPVTINDNTSIIQAISTQYYIKLDNGSIDCIRNSCNDEQGYWLSFNEFGQKTNINQLVGSEETYYLIYNKTSTVNEEKDNQAIKELLKI